MNQKYIDDRMRVLSSAFSEFRESIHTISNGYWALSTVEGLENFKNTENKTNYVTNAQEEIETKTSELEDVNKKLAGTITAEEREDLEYKRERISAQIRELNERIKMSEDFIKESTKELDDKYIEYRGNLRETINKFGKALGVDTTAQPPRSEFIEKFKHSLNSRLAMIQDEIEFYKNRFDNAQSFEERENYRKTLQELVSEQKRINGIFEKMDNLWSIYESLHRRYIKGHQNIDVDNLLSYSQQFEDLAIYFNKDANNEKIQVDFIRRADGSYAIEMRCGNMIVEPNPVVDATEDINERVAKYLDNFANYLCTKTNKTLSDYILSDVIIKENGKKLGEAAYHNVPGIAEAIRAGKDLENLKTEEEEKDLGSEQPAPQAPEEPVPGTPSEPTPAEPTPDEPTPGEPTPGTPGEPAPEGPIPGTPGEPTSEEPAPEEPTPEEPTPEEPVQQVLEEPTPQAPEAVPTVNGLDATDMHAIKVNARRAANKQMYKNFATVLGTAAIGLGFAGATLGFGLAPAAFVGGTFLATTGVEMIGKLRENIKFAATKRKFKKIAKRVDRELGILIEPVFDTKRRDCGFVLVDEEGNQLSDGYLTTDSMRQSLPQGLDDSIINIFTEEFEKANKYRGKGANASTLKEIRYREFPQITFDNAKAAFNEFGGVQTRSELNGFKFSTDRYVADIQENRVDNTPELGEVEEVNVDELEPQGPAPEFNEQPTPEEPTPGEPAPEEPVPGTPGEPTPEEPVPGTPGEPTPEEPIPGTPGEHAPGEPAPLDPQVQSGIADDVASIMREMEESGQSSLPDEVNAEQVQDPVQAAADYAHMVMNGLDSTNRLEKMKVGLEQGIESGNLENYEMVQDFIAELDAQIALTPEEKAALEEIVNNNIDKLNKNTEDKGMVL